MKKLFTNLKVALTLLLLCGVCSVWAETVVASYSRSETTNTTSGGTFTQNLLGQSGYYQDNSTGQTYYMQLKDNSAYWTTAPQSISFSAKLGGGNTRDPLGDGKMYVVLLDSNGNEISATTTEVTNKITNASGSEFTVEITSTANVYGVKLYHSKIVSYNIRYYSMSLSYEAGSTTPSKTLSSIAVSNQKTSFYEGDDFEFGGTVTASYEENDANDADVTNRVTFNGYDMSTTGEQAVTVSYTEGEITKTATYQIIVNARPAYTVTLSDDNSTLTETAGGDGVVLPSRTSGNPDYTFAGWSTTNIPEETATAPTIIPAGEYTPTSNIKLYPVYSRIETGSGFSKYEKVTSTPDDWSGQYLLSTGTYTATGTISSSHLTRDSYSDFSKEDTSREFTLTMVGDVGYSIRLGDVYLGWSDSTNFGTQSTAPKSNETAYLWSLSTSKISNVGTPARVIGDNGSSDFRPYSNPSSGIVYLYKKIEGGTTTYYASNPPALTVKAPTFTPATTEFLGSTSVTIACATEGASIYYTLDGTEPTKTSTPYIAAIEISGTTTVKAIAYKGTDASNVASKTFTKVVPLATMDAIFEASATAGDYWITFNNWVISGVKDNNNAYLTDNAGKGLIIYKINHGFVEGDKLSGTVKCALTKYNGSAEITDLTSSTEGLTVTKNGSLNTVEATIAGLGGVNTGAYINLGTLTYNGTEFTDGSNTIKPYNTFITLPSLTNGKKYNVKGVYIQYNDIKEFAPLTTDDFEEVASTEYDITINPSTNGIVTVDADDNKAQEGQVVTLMVTPNAHYSLESLIVKDASSNAVSVSEGNTFTMPASSVTISAIFTEKEKFTVTYTSLGTSAGSEEVYDGENIANAPTQTYTGWTFAGWTTNATYAMSTTAPELFDVATPITEDVNLYAVFSKADDGEGPVPSAYSVGAVGEFAIAAKEGDKWYALPNNPTVSSGKITAMEISVSTENGVDYVSEDDADGFIWTIAKLGDYYTISDGTKYIYHSNGGASGTNLTYGTSTSYLWNLTDENTWIKMVGVVGGSSTVNTRGMLFSGTTIGGYSLTNSSTSGYYETQILPVRKASIPTYTISVPQTRDVEVSSVGWATACLPFDATITSDNATAYYVTGTNGTALTKDEADVIPAGTGVLLKSNNGGAATVTFTASAGAAADATGNMMVGALTKTTFDEANTKYYILAKDETNGLGFYYQGADNTTGSSVECEAGKAVLAVPASAGAKAFFLFDDDATGIDAIRDSQCIMQYSQYNLNGMRVNDNYKGIVIINGKKVMK